MGDPSPEARLPPARAGSPEHAATVRAAAAAESPRHRQLITSASDGRALSAIMLRALALYTPRGHAVLTTTGRRSGLPRRNYVRAVRRSSTVYLVMLRPPIVALERPEVVTSWVFNARADPRVWLRMGRRVRAGTMRELDDPAEIAAAHEALCQSVFLVDDGEYLIHMRGAPTPATIRRMHRYWSATGVPLAIDLVE